MREESLSAPEPPAGTSSAMSCGLAGRPVPPGPAVPLPDSGPGLAGPALPESVVRSSRARQPVCARRLVCACRPVRPCPSGRARKPVRARHLVLRCAKADGEVRR